MDKVFAPKTLATAWTKVLANKGAAGVDGQSIERFAARTDDYLAELSAALREGTYFPQAVRRVDIPKGANSFCASRTGQDTTVGHSGSQGSHHGAAMFHMDVQQAVRLVIEPIFEHGFAEGSYGFRPGRGCHDALREVDRLIKEGYTHVVDADLQAYFDTIPHEERISDGRVLDLIRGWLKADILKGSEAWTPVQGSPRRGEARLLHDVR